MEKIRLEGSCLCNRNYTHIIELTPSELIEQLIEQGYGCQIDSSGKWFIDKFQMHQPKQECEHEWELRDANYESNAVVYSMCKKCGKVKEFDSPKPEPKPIEELSPTGMYGNEEFYRLASKINELVRAVNKEKAQHAVIYARAPAVGPGVL